MAALASRLASFNEYLHNPPWASEWIVNRRASIGLMGACVAASKHEACRRGPAVHRACTGECRYSRAAD
jgi:hypothetical protein